MLGIKQVVNPQRWNRYAYVVNNPLALYDADGQDDQGQGGSKIIDVFIAMPAAGQQDYRTVNRRPAAIILYQISLSFGRMLQKLDTQSTFIS